MLKQQEEEMKKKEQEEQDKQKKEQDDKEALQLDFSEMVRQFKESKDPSSTEESNNLQLSSDMKNSEDLLAQTGGKSFEATAAGSSLSFKLIPNNFGDTIDKISVVDLK